jgi:dihydrofolate reductase
MSQLLSIIVAVSQNNVIGKDNRLPWHIPEDFAWFKRHTRGHPVLMGRKTFESIGRPLPDRKNVVITRNREFVAEGTLIYHSLNDALISLKAEGHSEIFIIGGHQVFRDTIDMVDRIYLTRILRDYDGDVYMPAIPENVFSVVFEEQQPGETPFVFMIYERKG